MQCAAHSTFPDYVNIISVKMYWTMVKNLLLWMMNNKSEVPVINENQKQKRNTSIIYISWVASHATAPWGGVVTLRGES